MEASTFTTPAFMTSYLPHQTLTPPSFASHQEPAATIKMEDLQKHELPLSPLVEEHNESSADLPSATAASASSHSASASSSPTEGGSKQVKKRKSWGQVLPEPKTNLPPRKRAKTEDEKEQRRIERVKRNRLAAHNSRERKRQEVEALQQDKAALELRVQQLEEAIRVYQQHLPDLKVEALNFQPTAQPGTPASIDSGSETINPRTASFASMTPQTSPSLGSIDSPPFTDSQPATPEAFPEATAAEHDQTQHSAVSVLYQQPSALDGKHLGVSSSDLFAHHVQSPASYDSAALDDLFNFSSFDDLTGHLHNDQDKYPNTFFETQFPDDLVTMDLPNGIGGDLDLLAASGATSIVSDETGIADAI